MPITTIMAAASKRTPISTKTTLGVPAGSANFVAGDNFRASSDVNGSIRGRIGYAWDRFLVYGTGGVAFAAHVVGFLVGVAGVFVFRKGDRDYWGDADGAADYRR